jgi:hypothetical protein
MTQPASVGSHLLYTYQGSDHCSKTAVGQSRPAVVVRDWGSCYNVTIFPDCNDFADGRATVTRTSIQLSDCIAKGRLHWPGSPVEVESAPEPAPTVEDVLEVVAPSEPSAPEGAQSEPLAVPEAPKPVQTTIAPPKKNKGGRPKKNKPAGK